MCNNVWAAFFLSFHKNKKALIRWGELEQKEDMVHDGMHGVPCFCCYGKFYSSYCMFLDLIFFILIEITFFFCSKCLKNF